MYLKLGQVVYIKDKKFVISNMIEYQENSWKWQEYELISKPSNHICWLSIEKDENDNDEYYLYNTFSQKIDTNSIEINIYDKKFKLYEKGHGKVTYFFGNTDVDPNEKFEYIDYISEDENTIISIENWDGSIEKSIGTYLDSQYINITDTVEKPKVSSSTSNKSNLLVNLIVTLIIIFSAMFPFLSGLFINKSISKYLSKNPSKYTYVTSITNNTNKEKAKVYKSKFLSIDLTVKDIINGVPEGISNVSEETLQNPSSPIGLHTRSEYAYIYKENSNIYIQISNKKYITSSGNMYHSNHNSNYHRYYSRFPRSGYYTNYAASARQSSINSRRSSGGGTSSGK